MTIPSKTRAALFAVCATFTLVTALPALMIPPMV